MEKRAIWIWRGGISLAASGMVRIWYDRMGAKGWGKDEKPHPPTFSRVLLWPVQGPMESQSMIQ